MSTARIVAAIAACLALAACHQEAVPVPDNPRLAPNVILRDVTFESASLGRKTTYRAILPAKALPSQKLSVVYLLHGGGGNFHDWSNYSDVARFAERGLVLIMPEGASSYYVNAVDRPDDRYEDYVVKDLISDVESRFPVAPDRASRAIVGVSMGGFGALNLALKHPDLFVFAAGISSAIDVPSRPFSIKRIRQYRGHAAIFGAWGSQTRRENDPFVRLQTVDVERVPYLYLTCGDQEGLLPASRKFAGLLEKRHFKYEFQVSPGGHDWNQWNRSLGAVFRSMSERMDNKKS